MILETALKIKNYKCFGNEFSGFERIYPINVIVGKNNSGKSSLIDLIKHGVALNNDLLHSKKDCEIYYQYIYTDKVLKVIFPNMPGAIPHMIDLKVDINQISTSRKISNFSKEINEQNKNTILSSQMAFRPIPGKNIKCVTAERDIVPETPYNEIQLLDNGSNATKLIQLLITNSKYDTSLIDRHLLKELNSILNPDIKFTDIQIQQHDGGMWEIYFEDEANGLIALSKMGSGIKTILLVLLNLLVLPIIESKNKNTYIFAFEELENNLHPSLLRRLFSYLAKYSEENQAYFFITTHSSIVIDLFSNNDNAQIIHVTNNGKESSCTTVSTFADNKKILKDLDVRASDLLQSNGIIWVEGPSDRIYINKWINLLAPNLLEGSHYSILFYGGKLLANLCFDFDSLEKELIPLLKINHNSFVIIDRDGDSEQAKLNHTKERIQKEIGSDNCWITQGREIENYLTDVTLSKWLSASHAITKKIRNNPDTKLENSISIVDKTKKIKYNTNKKGYSMEIESFISVEDLNYLDLKGNIELLIRKIKEWNSIA